MATTSMAMAAAVMAAMATATMAMAAATKMAMAAAAMAVCHPELVEGHPQS
jgi:hypothetical protein